MFVRFVVGTDSDNAYDLTGIIAIAREIDDDSGFEPHESEFLKEVFAWFNENLPCPPFEENLSAGIWTPDAVAWFKAEAKGPLNRMWDIVALLREKGVRVRFVRTDRPGPIVYEDEFQVVAETPPRRRQDRRL